MLKIFSREIKNRKFLDFEWCKKAQIPIVVDNNLAIQNPDTVVQFSSLAQAQNLKTTLYSKTPKSRRLKSGYKKEQF